MEHEIIVYQGPWSKNVRAFTVDCERHSISHHTWLFSDAIGRALLHRGAVIR